MIKLLHTGDLHLDSPFSDVTLAEGERLREGLRLTFENILDGGCDTDKYDAVLIAGDLFDCGFICPDTVARIRDAFSRFDGPVIVAPGNHDPYTSDSVWALTEWGENVHIFRSQTPSVFELEINGERLAVHGWAFNSDRLDGCPVDGIKPLSGMTNIICAHGDTSSPISKYAPLPASSLAASGCVYAALGHIHNPPPTLVAGDCTALYCGFPEGRSFDEAGFGSILSVTLDNGRVIAERKISSHRRYETVHFDVTGADSDRECASRIASLCREKGYGRETSLKVYLEGAVPPSYVPDITRIVPNVAAAGAEVTPLLLRDMTQPVYGAEYLADDLSIKGELYRKLLPRLNSADPRERETASRALRIGLLALDGRAFM